MKIVLNGNDVLDLDDQRTRRGYRILSSSQNSFNPAPGLAVFVEDPQVGAHPWVAYVRIDEDGAADLESTPATRMPLSKSRITHIQTLTSPF